MIAWRSSNAAQSGFTMFANDSLVVGQGTLYGNLEAMARVATLAPHEQGKNATLNNFVVMLHEIGHAKQFIDNPVWFRSNEGTGSYIAPQREAVKEILAYQTGKTWGIEGKANRILGNAHKAFSSAIEWDNYLYHEGPICDEIGVARRGRYTNINMTFGSTSISGNSL